MIHKNIEVSINHICMASPQMSYLSSPLLYEAQIELKSHENIKRKKSLIN